jgi:hypothetical protein
VVRGGDTLPTCGLENVTLPLCCRYPPHYFRLEKQLKGILIKKSQKENPLIKSTKTNSHIKNKKTMNERDGKKIHIKCQA